MRPESRGSWSEFELSFSHSERSCHACTSNIGRIPLGLLFLVYGLNGFFRFGHSASFETAIAREYMGVMLTTPYSHDPAASLNSIAKAAGVGAGTLYRHFPSRESLVLAVYRKEIDALVALAPLLLGKQRPLHAFRSWCDRLANMDE